MRDTNGRFASLRSKISKYAAIAFFAAFLVGCGVASAKAQKPAIPQASLEKVDAYEQLVQLKTEERMKDPEFIKETRERARIDVVMAITNKSQAELYDYLNKTK